MPTNLPVHAVHLLEPGGARAITLESEEAGSVWLSIAIDPPARIEAEVVGPADHALATRGENYESTDILDGTSSATEAAENVELDAGANVLLLTSHATYPVAVSLWVEPNDEEEGDEEEGEDDEDDEDEDEDDEEEGDEDDEEEDDEEEGDEEDGEGKPE